MTPQFIPAGARSVSIGREGNGVECEGLNPELTYLGLNHPQSRPDHPVFGLTKRALSCSTII